MSPQGRWLLGLSFVLVVALIWVVASFVVQFVEKEGIPTFLLTYICNSLFVLYLPIVELQRLLLWWRCKRHPSEPSPEPAAPASPSPARRRRFQFDIWRRVSFGSSVEGDDATPRGQHPEVDVPGPPPNPGDAQDPHGLGEEAHTGDAGEVTRLGSFGDDGNWIPRGGSSIPIEIHRAAFRSIGPGSPQGLGPLSDVVSDEEWELSDVDITDADAVWHPRKPRKVHGERYQAAVIGLTIMPLWFFAQYTFNLSLHYTSVTSNTILSSSSSLFTFLLSIAILGEPFTCLNLTMVLVCIAGTVIVSLADTEATPSPNPPPLNTTGTRPFAAAPTHWASGGGHAALGFNATGGPTILHSPGSFRPLGGGVALGVFGDMLCLASALAYGLYTVMLRKLMPDEGGGEDIFEEVEMASAAYDGVHKCRCHRVFDGVQQHKQQQHHHHHHQDGACDRAQPHHQPQQSHHHHHNHQHHQNQHRHLYHQPVSTAMAFGFVGLFGALLLWPVLLVLHFTGLEPISGVTRRQLSMIVGKGLLDNVLSDYLWARAVLLMTPTAATASLNIQIPIAIVADYLVARRVPRLLTLLGGIAIVVGFLGINQPVTKGTCCGLLGTRRMLGFQRLEQDEPKEQGALVGDGASSAKPGAGTSPRRTTPVV